MVAREDIIGWLNSIEWLSEDVVSERAQTLIRRHLDLIRPIIKTLVTEKKVEVSYAHGLTMTAGHSSPCGESLLDELFSKATFRNAGAREPMIAIVVAAFCWHSDDELSRMENPWPPLIDLMALGYSCSFEDDIDFNGVTLWVGYRNGIAKYRIVLGPRSEQS